MGDATISVIASLSLEDFVSPPHPCEDWFSKGPDTKPSHSPGKMARSDHGDKLLFIILPQLSFLNVILAIINHSE